MEKRFWAIIAVIVLIFAGIIWFSNKDSNKTGESDSAEPTNHIKGKADAKVKLVEYGDFQCPACGSYYPVVSQVITNYQDKISFQFRNLPLTQIHQHALAAARAAEAADKQGKFWEMYDMLFSNQQSWSPATQPVNTFNQYAAQLGLNTEQFKKDFASPEVNRTINADIAEYRKTGNQLATPAFFLNGKKIEAKQLSEENGSPSYEKFAALLDAELKKQQ